MVVPSPGFDWKTAPSKSSISIKNRKRIYTLRDVNALVAPVGTQQATNQDVLLSIQASASGDHLQRFTIEGEAAPNTGQWQIKGNQIRIDLSPTLRDSLPVELSRHIGVLGSLVAKSEVNFDITYDPRKPTPMTYKVGGSLRNGRLEDPRLPYPLMDVTADFHCDHKTAVVEKIKARYGGATVDLSIEQSGHASNETMAVSGTVKNFTVREDLISRLSKDIQQKWRKFQPLGNCDVAFSFQRAGGRWIPSAEVTCHDVSLTWEKFRYPLRNTTGRISIRDSELAFDLRSRGTPQPVLIRGHVHDPGVNWRGWFEAHTQGSIPIDETLVAAGSPATQRIVRPFAARGNLAFATRSERTRTNLPITKSAIIQLVDCTIQHSKFAYPLNGVNGRLEMTNDNWKFKNLHGRNDTARIQCSGSWDKKREGGWLSLNFTGKDVPVDGELRQALPAAAQRTWQKLRPQGTLDHLRAEYNLAPKINHSSVGVELKQWQQPQKALARTMSITPTGFPYRVDDVTGTVLYRDGKLQMTGMKGKHGPVEFSTNGRATYAANDGWNLEFSRFHADHLRMDNELLKAAPVRLSRAIARMGLKGATSIDGTWQLSSAGPEAPTNSRWDLTLDLEDGTLGNRWKLEHIVGGAKLIGEANADRFVCRGSVSLDSMTTGGIQIANLHSPFWFDGKRLLLGAWAQPAGAGETPLHLTARVFGGTLQADTQIRMDDLGTFETNLRLDGANIATVARDMKLPVSRIAGAASATLALHGNEQGRQTWRGKGAVHMQNTDLYELPFMLSLVKTLRTGSTNRSAFDEVAIDFRVQGEHTYLDHVDLRGDALTLKGAGELNRQRDVNLDFYTIVGRENSYIEAVRPLLGMASRRFMMVKVRGPLDKPAMTREMLPGLNDTLQELFPEATQPVRGGSIERASYQLRPGVFAR